MKNRFLLFFCVLIFFVISCASKQKKASTPLDFKIISVNDIHGHINHDDAITMGKLSSFKKELQSDGSDVLYLDAGDLVAGGDIFASIAKGKPMIDIYNSLGVDAMAVGNHEFDYGYQRLMELKDMASFPFLSANVRAKDGSFPFQRYIIKTLSDNTKVGIFGLTTPETAYKTHPNNVKDIEFLPITETAQEMTKTLLSKEKVDFVIALVHIGIEGQYDSRETLKEINGIDLIIDGHSHTLIQEPVDLGGPKLIQAGKYIENMGLTHVTRQDGQTIANIDYQVFDSIDTEEDPEIQAIIEQSNQENFGITEKIVSSTAVDLDGLRENIRTRRTNLGSLIASSMLLNSGADLALTNGGGIRASISSGDVTLGDVLTVLPFGNMVMQIEVPGSVIKEALEHGADTLPDPAGHFLQVAGIEYKIAVENEVGNRISEVMINGEALDLQKIYKLATNDFMAVGGDGYDMFKPYYEDRSEFDTLDQAFIRYLEEVGTETTELVQDEPVVQEEEALN